MWSLRYMFLTEIFCAFCMSFPCVLQVTSNHFPSLQHPYDTNCCTYWEFEILDERNSIFNVASSTKNVDYIWGKR
jgi:hypothetical protein